MTSEFSNEFQPIRPVDPDGLADDKLLTKLKHNHKIRKTESAKRREANLKFFKTFRLFNATNPSSSQLLDNVSPDEQRENDNEPINSPSQSINELLSADSSDISFIQSTIKKQLLRPTRIAHHSQFNEIYKMMENTIDQKEGSSTLVLGPKSSGKSMIINKALSLLTESYPQQFVTIKLNSSIHNDDITAIRAIASQLDSFFASKGANIKVEFRKLNTTFKNILNVLNHEDIKIPIIFIFDNLETFTIGNKQILLYNLLDLTQTSTTPILVIGTSSKFTTRELLEKRVRSRFSQRLIIITKVPQLDEFISNCVENLKLSQNDIDKLTNPNLGAQWNSQFEQLLFTDSQFKQQLVQNFNSVRNVKSFNNAMMLPILKLTSSSPLIDDTQVAIYQKTQITNPIQEMLNSLSNLELLMVVAGARVIEKSKLVSINFNLAYKEYVTMIKELNLKKSQANSSSMMHHSIMANVKVNIKIWDIKVMKNCWITLYKLGLLLDYVPNTVEGGVLIVNSNKYFILEDSKMVQLDVTLMELSKYLGDSFLKPLTKL